MKCRSCQTDNLKTYSFCNNCGAKLNSELVDNYHVSVKKTKIFFFILLGYIGLLHYLKFNSTYVTSLITDLIFAIIVVIFLALNFIETKPLLIPKNLNFKLLIVLSISLIGLAFLVSHLSNFLNENIFNSNQSGYYEQYIDSPFPLLLCIISVGVFPALFEEIAFRGILFSELKNIMSVNATIIITTILFTVLHFSFISFLWIFPIGYLFGYLRSKYDNLSYGIIGHFIYNTSIVLIEYFSQ